MSDTVKHINVVAKTAYKDTGIPVNVNSSVPLKLSTEDYDVYLVVRIKDYTYSGTETVAEKKDQEESLKYFQTTEHLSDSVSIQFAVTFKKDVPGANLKWGNDWDAPIRDILPWGFSAAFASFKYFIDPGIESDVYSDHPWIYGPALSSINYMRALVPPENPATYEGPIEEVDAVARHKKYLEKTNLEAFTFEKGKTYAFDFVNPYLDMSTTPKIKMPGFTFDVGKYAGLTELRYVLKNDDQLVFALVFSAETS